MMILSRPTGHGGQIRGQTAGAVAASETGRFGRMFTDLALSRPEFSDALLTDLALLMTSGPPVGATNPSGDKGRPIRDTTAADGTVTSASDAGDENPTIPAGYTYFGQFVDHDISFDPTSLNAKNVDPEALVDFRTPALDLDSVYGSGPDTQPTLYAPSSLSAPSPAVPKPLLRVGDDLGMDQFTGIVTRHDHLRLAPEDPAQPDVGRTAVIGDKRNDENKIVAQIHTAFVAFHNKVMGDDAILQQMGGSDLDLADNRFRTAVKAVRWHYQWVVVFDYLRNRICQPGVVDAVFNAGGTPRLNHYLHPEVKYAYMPLEFSVAAYRLGHSMVRPSYALNAIVGATGEFAQVRVPIFVQGAGPLQALNGFGQAIPKVWGIDWSFFLDGLPKPADEPGKTPLAIPQPSYRIDATLVDPLRHLPEFTAQLPEIVQNLAFRNLQRGSLYRLPCGEAVALALGLNPIQFEDLWWAGSLPRNETPDPDRADLAQKRADFGEAHRDDIEDRTPLWYYILREAEIFGTQHGTAPDPFGGQHLGPVGSRIVAETFIGLLWLDRNSFMHSQTGFKPVLPQAGTDFVLADLFRYALS
jgi:hypothetical protein